MDKAVIMARGLGTRMRAVNEGASLSAEQSVVASTGIKALMPIGRPFLDYVLSALADAGFRRVCLVIGPEHDALRQYCLEQLDCKRLIIEWAIQEEPIGTADAVVAARAFCDSDEFVVINSDNYYPINALKGLREMDGPGVVAYSQESMLKHGNIVADRLQKFAIVEGNENGMLHRIIEKPTEMQLSTIEGKSGIGMNSWRFDEKIFEACSSIQPSSRGEFELPDAVQFAMVNLGVPFFMEVFEEAVLDLSDQGDVEAVRGHLQNTEVNL